MNILQDNTQVVKINYYVKKNFILIGLLNYVCAPKAVQNMKAKKFKRLFIDDPDLKALKTVCNDHTIYLNADQRYMVFICAIVNQNIDNINFLSDMFNIKEAKNVVTKNSLLYFALKYAFCIEIIKCLIENHNFCIYKDLGNFNGAPVHLICKTYNYYYEIRRYLKKSSIYKINGSITKFPQYYKNANSDELKYFDSIYTEKKNNRINIINYLWKKYPSNTFFPIKRFFPIYNNKYTEEIDLINFTNSLSEYEKKYASMYKYDKKIRKLLLEKIVSTINLFLGKYLQLKEPQLVPEIILIILQYFCL